MANIVRSRLSFWRAYLLHFLFKVHISQLFSVNQLLCGLKQQSVTTVFPGHPFNSGIDFEAGDLISGASLSTQRKATEA